MNSDKNFAAPCSVTPGTPELNQVLVATGPTAPISSPHRVLSMSRQLDAVWMIPLPPPGRGKEYTYYLPGVTSFSLNELERALSNGSIQPAVHRLPAHWLLSDEDYLETATSEKERKFRTKRLKKRDAAWNLISPLFKGRTIASVAEHYKSLGPALKEIATTNEVALSTVKRSLNLYLSSGGAKNGLIPRTENCGAPGTKRDIKKPTGRPRKPVVDGKEPPKNYILSEKDKQRCGLGLQLKQARISLHDAYLIACFAFWSEHYIDEAGNQKNELFPENERPSQEQFLYWGRKESPLAVERLAGRPKKTALAEAITRNGGASTDITSVVGVNAMFDGTSTDVYLVSVKSRNRVLPPMTRMIIKEPLSSAVIGVYCDWQPASPNAALKAIRAAAEDKHELCKRFGIDCPIGQWPGMLCRSYLADNGELRAAEITDVESLFGFSIEYAKTYHGASKGDVESQHRTDHVAVDNKLPGATQGRRKSRGEKDPADDAILNYYEYMNILLRHYIKYNNELVPERAPLEMIQAGITPSRINILKWYRDTHQSAEIKVDLEHLRAHTLDRWPAVIKENGIYLKSLDKKRIYAHHRYYSDDIRVDKRFKDAQSLRRSQDVMVRIGMGIDKVWLPTETGMIELRNVSTNTSTVAKSCIADVDDDSAQLLQDERRMKASADQSDLDELLNKETVVSNARREQREENRASGGGPSKKARKGNMRETAREERHAVGAHDADSTASALDKEARPTPSKWPKASNADASDRAMGDFLRTLS